MSRSLLCVALSSDVDGGASVAPRDVADIDDYLDDVGIIIHYQIIILLQSRRFLVTKKSESNQKTGFAEFRARSFYIFNLSERLYQLFCLFFYA